MTANSSTESPTQVVIIQLPEIDSVSSKDGELIFTKTLPTSEGWYKCSVKSINTNELVEKEVEVRVLYPPSPPGSKPIMEHRIDSDYIYVTCSAPASHPPTVLTFFVNNELPADDEVAGSGHVMVTNTSYGEDVSLPMTVAQLRIRPTRNYILNDKVEVVCAATLSSHYFQYESLTIEYQGSIYYQKKCLSGAMIVLIVIGAILVVIFISGIIWFVVRKKKMNSLNKVTGFLVNKNYSVENHIENKE